MGTLFQVGVKKPQGKTQCWGPPYFCPYHRLKNTGNNLEVPKTNRQTIQFLLVLSRKQVVVFGTRTSLFGCSSTTCLAMFRVVSPCREMDGRRVGTESWPEIPKQNLSFQGRLTFFHTPTTQIGCLGFTMIMGNEALGTNHHVL